MICSVVKNECINYRLIIDLYHKVNISRLYSTYDDATTSLTEHIYRYILRGGLILSDSRIYVS